MIFDCKVTGDVMNTVATVASFPFFLGIFRAEYVCNAAQRTPTLSATIVCAMNRL